MKLFKIKFLSLFVLVMTFLLGSDSAHSKAKVIVFDLGDVILKLNWEKPLSLMGISDKSSKDLFKKILTSHEGAYDQFERGKMSQKEFFLEFKKDLSLSCDVAMIEKAWESLIVGPVDGIEKILDKISNHYDLYLLTNASENVYHYLRLDSPDPLYPVLSKFKKIYTSFQLKARKPERELYSQVLEDLKKSHQNLHSSEILFIDDRQDNVDGAIRAGWKAEKSVPANAESVNAILEQHGIL